MLFANALPNATQVGSKNENLGQALWEKYRPHTFDEVVGQDKAVAKIKRVLSHGWGGRYWWISGPSGHGKTTLARIIAKQKADPTMGIFEYACADVVTLKEVQGIASQSLYMFSEGLAYIINEAQGLRKPIIRILMGIRENGDLASHTSLIFTTTKEAQEDFFEAQIDAGPLLSRCIPIQLRHNGVREVYARRCQEIAVAEGLDGGKPERDFIQLAKECGSNFRTMLNEIEAGRML